MKKTLLMLGFSALSLLSCNKQDMTQNSALADGIGAVVSLSEVDIPPLGSTVTFSLTTNSPWSINNVPSWIELNKKSGKAGTTNITMTVSENDESSASRTRKLYFECEDGTYEKITINQVRPYVTVNPEKIDFGWDHYKPWGSESLTLQIESNVGWTITDVTTEYSGGQSMVGLATDQWLICPDETQYSGRGNAELSFMTRRYNIKGEDNQTVLKITRETTLSKEEYVIVKLTQDSRRLIVVDEDGTPDRKIELEACNNEDAIISVDTEKWWKSLSVDRDDIKWVQVSDESEIEIGKKDYLRINADANPSSEPRQDQVVVYAVENESDGRMIPDTIWISQKGYIFEAEQTSLMEFANNNATEQSFVLASSGRWSVDADSKPEWMDVTSQGEANTNEKNVKLCPNSQNLEFEDRTAKIIFQTDEEGNDMTQSVDVSQKAYIFTANAAKTQIETLSTNTFDLAIESSGEWRVDVNYDGSNEDDWLYLSKESGSGNATITYNAKSENTSKDYDKIARVSVYSVTHENAGISCAPKEFNIKQLKYTFAANPDSGHKFAFVAVPNNTYNLEVNCSVPWKITTAYDWIKAEPSSGDGNDGKVTVKISATNNTDAATRDNIRNGSFKVASYIKGEEIDIKNYNVSQDAFVFSTSTTSVFENLPAVIPSTAKYTVDVKCSGPWEVNIANNTSSKNWITADKTSGTGNATITFTVAHGEAQARSAEVTITSTLTSQTSPVYKFSQEAYVLKADKSELSQFKATGKAGQQVNVTCSGKWKVAGKPEWVTVSLAGEVNGNGSFTVKASDNVTKEARPGTIKVQSVDNSDLVVDISVSQDAYEFATDKTNLEFKAEDAEVQTVNVTCTGKWTVTSEADWITVKLNGESTGNGSFTVTAVNNTDTNVQEGAIKVECVDNPSLVVTIKVSQEKATVKEDENEKDN